MAIEATQSARRAANNRHAPEGAVERGAARRIHQERRTIRRNIENVGKARVFERVGNGKGVAPGDGSLRKSRLSLDEVEAGAVGDDTGFWLVGVGELNCSQHA